MERPRYDGGTVAGAKPGDYLAFEWDDVVHDVWLVPLGTPNLPLLRALRF